jgi:CPA1 family monovalent cation:H+ antiporter
VRRVAVVAAVIVDPLPVGLPGTYLPRPVSRACASASPRSHWHVPAIVAWTGMRGAVSLAAALAIPHDDRRRRRLPAARPIIFLTYAVISATLILQGLTLPRSSACSGVEDDGTRAARVQGAHAGRARRARRHRGARGEDWVRDDTADRMRGLYDFRIRRFSARFDDDDDGAIDERSSPTSACGARCSRPSAPRSSACATGQINDEIMRASSATSTSRTRA